MSERLLLTEEVADRCRTTAATVRYWRHVGYGPPGIKVGRRVLYRASEVESWLDGLGATPPTGQQRAPLSAATPAFTQRARA